MSVVRGEARRRWLLVTALVAALCSIPFAIAAFPVAGADVDPQRLRGLILGSAERPYQGLAESTGSLGIPDLPGLDDATGLLGGTSRMRVWYDAPENWRVALVTATGERDFLRSKTGLAIWDYESEQLTKIQGAQTVRLPNAADLMPPDLGRRLLRLSTPADRLTGLDTRRIAGRSAAGLRVTPADSATTIGSVDIWADPETGVPLEVRIVPRGGSRAVLTTRLLDVRFARPAASAVAPRFAPGVRTSEVDTFDLLARLASRTTERMPASLAGRPALDSTPSIASVRAYSGGYSSFVVAPLPGRYGRRVFEAARTAGAGSLAVSRGEALALQTSVLTAVLVREEAIGRTFLLAGPVRPDLLRTAANELIS
ncbi:hypothetical protein [Actinomadura rudentiformis]|uniref:MucB/RseB N-terminal domain-containing protein n=1 Tax=Actinomadura rudentiformis TaxID=359158 RepID=A0A6H9YZK4_9ACTN|nr:hypothetical protein [Actinomadura rudentiformis]KAB2348299.1 hypothetical protein F8566_15935 [Actinomadura rudentiformis]